MEDLKPASDTFSPAVELNPHWYLSRTEPFQERLGGRIALAAKIDIAGLPLTSYNLHLESRANDDLRVAQLEDVLRDTAANDRNQLIILAGDFNLNASKRAAAEVISGAGFRDVVPTARVPTTPKRAENIFVARRSEQSCRDRTAEQR